MYSIPLFSLVVFPEEAQITQVRELKQRLKNRIGWFGSANAAAHITVVNFEDENSLSLYIEKIRIFCKNQIPERVLFNSWNSFGDKTFFIAPDESSLLFLNSFISNLLKNIGLNAKNVHAHMSIARGLNAETMKIASELFKNQTIHIEFECNAIYIRKFNNQTKQYTDIIEKIDFEG